MSQHGRVNVLSLQGRVHHNIKRANRAFDNVSNFKFLFPALTNENWMHEEATSGINSENTCKSSGQNLLDCHFVLKNVKIKIFMQNCNFTWCCMWVWNLVPFVMGRIYFEGF